VTRAIDTGRRALAWAAELRHAHTFGYAFGHVCMLHTLERDTATVKSLASQMLAAATTRELQLWMSVSRAFLGWCGLEPGSLDKGIRILEGERGFLRVAQVTYWLPVYLCWLAEAYADTGRPQEARACLDEARAVIGPDRFWYEIECLRIEARIAADGDQAERCFEEALALAHRRGQLGFALRVARSFADLLGRMGQPSRACALLRQALAPFADQPDGGDRADARALLRALEDASRG
jgi:tetratricopeptide (TPR) repeat protein